MLQAGAMAPDFGLADFRLTEQLEHAPVLLVLFKVSCPTCQFTLPFVERLRANVPSIFGISQDGADATREFAEHFGITFPLLLDGAGYPVSNAYQITSVPSLFLVESDGRISWAQEGFHKSELERLGKRFGASPFRDGERVPAMRPG